MSTRRSFLAGAAATTVFAAPAIAQGLSEWRMVTTWPRDFPGVGVGAQRLADRIGELTDGKLKVRLFAAGELVPGQENMAKVMAGEVELSHDMASYYLAKSPAFAFFSSIPFGLIARELGRRFAANDPARIEAISARFSAAVFPGQALQLHAWTGHGRVAFKAFQDGRLVIDGGSFAFVDTATL